MKEYARRLLKATEHFDREGCELVWNQSDYSKTPTLLEMGFQESTLIREVASVDGRRLLCDSLDELGIDGEVQGEIFGPLYEFGCRVINCADMLPILESDKEELTVGSFLGISAEQIQKLDGYSYLEAKIIERLFSHTAVISVV